MLIVAVVTPSSLTNDKIAPGGTPLLRNATSVYSLGSSQPLTIFSSTSFLIFRLDRTVPVTFKRPYSLCIGLWGTSTLLFSHSYETLDKMNSVVHSEWVMPSKLSHKQCVKSYVG